MAFNSDGTKLYIAGVQRSAINEINLSNAFDLSKGSITNTGTYSIATEETNITDVIFNEEESWNASESTKKELEDFIDQLNTKQFKQIEDFFSTMPKLTHSIKVKNPNTGVESSVILEGLAAFFN